MDTFRSCIRLMRPAFPLSYRLRSSRAFAQAFYVPPLWRIGDAPLNFFDASSDGITIDAIYRGGAAAMSFDEPEISTEDDDRDEDGAYMTCGDFSGCCPHDGCGACSKCLGVGPEL